MDDLFVKRLVLKQEWKMPWSFSFCRYYGSVNTWKRPGACILHASRSWTKTFKIDFRVSKPFFSISAAHKNIILMFQFINCNFLHTTLLTTYFYDYTTIFWFHMLLWRGSVVQWYITRLQLQKSRIWFSWAAAIPVAVVNGISL